MIKQLFLLSTILLFITSCNKEQKPKIVHVENNGKELSAPKKDTLAIDIAALPIQIDSTNYVIHAIGSFTIEDKRGKTIYKSSNYRNNNFSISSYNGNIISGNLSNLKFQHIDSETLIPLTEKLIKIRSASFLRQVFNNSKKQLLLYEVTDRDSNQDGQLDFNDINTLYISTINGSNFKKITATNNELIDWSILESKNRLYFRTIEDINKDGEFDKKDIIHYKYIDLNTENLKTVEYNPI